MNYQELLKDNDFHRWHEYEPIDTQYARYAKTDPSVIAAGHKIVDVYYAFADARAMFIYSFSENFGDIVGDKEIDRLYAKSNFLRQAVLDYALCLDMSWQVIWAFIQPASFEYIIKNEYKNMEKVCTSENVHLQLNCAVSQGMDKARAIKNLLLNFENDEDVKEVRTLYNSIKHHGTIHIKGLGINFSSLMITVEGVSVKTLNREEFSIEDIESMLWIYHQKFQVYFNSLIQLIMPDDYLNNSCDLEEMINTNLKMHEFQQKLKDPKL